jgi:hypothetical protein
LWVSKATFVIVFSTAGSPYESNFICGSAIVR